MSLTKLPLGRNNSVMTSLFPPRESLVVTSRLGTGNSRTFFLRCMLGKIWQKGSLKTCSKFSEVPTKFIYIFIERNKMKKISSKQVCSKIFLPYYSSYTLHLTHPCSLFTWIFSTYLMHVFFAPGIYFTHTVGTVQVSLCFGVFSVHMLTEYYCLSFPQKKNGI
jgi:hypothetical protein